MKFAMRETADMVERRYKYIGYIYMYLCILAKRMLIILDLKIKTIIKKG